VSDQAFEEGFERAAQALTAGAPGRVARAVCGKPTEIASSRRRESASVEGIEGVESVTPNARR
jgi:hypothetical protein